MFKDIKNIALTVLLGVIIFLSLRGPKTVTKDNTIYKTDTVEVTKVRYDTIWKTITKTKVVKVPEYIVIDDSTKQYSDTIAFDRLKIHYKLQTTGSLKNIELGYTDLRPSITKIEEHTKTITNTVIRYQNGIFIGGELGGNATTFNFSPKVDIRLNKWNYSYRYNIIDKSHNVGVSFNIIPFKSK